MFNAVEHGPYVIGLKRPDLLYEMISNGTQRGLERRLVGIPISLELTKRVIETSNDRQRRNIRLEGAYGENSGSKASQNAAATDSM